MGGHKSGLPHKSCKPKVLQLSIEFINDEQKKSRLIKNFIQENGMKSMKSTPEKEEKMKEWLDKSLDKVF